MQRNADDGLSRTPLSDGGAGGQLVLVNSAKRTELTTESARRTENGVSRGRREGVRHIKTELAWHKEKSWIAPAQIFRSFSYWFQRSSRLVDFHVAESRTNCFDEHCALD